MNLHGDLRRLEQGQLFSYFFFDVFLLAGFVPFFLADFFVDFAAAFLVFFLADFLAAGFDLLAFFFVLGFFLAFGLLAGAFFLVDFFAAFFLAAFFFAFFFAEPDFPNAVSQPSEYLSVAPTLRIDMISLRPR